MARVFVSYARAAQVEAKRIVDWLENAGHEVWWDRNLLANRQFSDAIQEQLDAADSVLVLWSKDSAGSEWVRAEADIARNDKKLVQASVDGTLPPIPFNQFHCEQLRTATQGENSATWQKLLTALAQSGNVVDYKGRTAQTPSISRRTALIGTGAGSLALAAGGYFTWNSSLFGAQDTVNRLAVLPFQVRGEVGDKGYFIEGFAAEIRSILARNPLFHVAAKVSSNAFRSQAATAGEICEKLGVDYLLNGDIRIENGRLIGSAELAEGSEERVLRPFDINVPIGSVLVIQQQIVSEIVQQIAGSAGIGIAADEIGGTQLVAAYEAFLRGEELYESGLSEETDRAALAEFDKAIMLDPNYAAAHAMRSRTLGLIGNLYGAPEDQKGIFEESIASAKKAIAIAPRFANGHAVLASVRESRQLDMAAARKPYRLAYELGAADSDILSRYANFRGRLKDFASAREAIDAAIDLDPLNSRVFRFSGNINYAAGNYSEAVADFENALKLQENLSSHHYHVGLCELAVGDLESAKRSFQAEKFFVWQKTGLAIVEHKLGNLEEAERHLTELKKRQGDKSHYQYMQIYAQWGNQVAALAAMDDAWKARDSGFVLFYVDPLIDSLRSNPRVDKLNREIGFI